MLLGTLFMTTTTLSSITTMREATAPQQITETQIPEVGRKQRIVRAQWIAELNGSPPFPALELVTKPNLTTAEAAYFLNRSPQTLRVWAMRDGTGPIRPKRIGGILAWSTASVKALAGVA